MTDPRHNDELILEKIRGLELLLDTRFKMIEKYIENSEETFATHQKELNIVRLWQANSTGKFAIINIIIGAGIMVFIAWVSKHF